MISDSGDIDGALGFLRDGYLFGSRRFRQVDDNAFSTRLLGVPVVVMRGSDAARFFYEHGRFDRTASLPPSVTHLLQDRKSVQTLEGEAHRHRKSLFTHALMGPDAMRELDAAVEREWMKAAQSWPHCDRVSLAVEVPRILARAIITWTGIDETESEVRRKGSELLAMIDNAGRIGPLNWVARARRLSTEKWARMKIEGARNSPDDFAGETSPCSRTSPRRCVASFRSSRSSRAEPPSPHRAGRRYFSGRSSMPRGAGDGLDHHAVGQIVDPFDELRASTSGPEGQPPHIPRYSA